MRHLANGQIPCEYDLGLQLDPLHFRFYVAQDWIAQVPRIEANCKPVRMARLPLQPAELGKWQGIFDRAGQLPLGYGGILVNKGWDPHGEDDNSFLRYETALKPMGGDRIYYYRLAATLSVLTSDDAALYRATYSRLLQLVTVWIHAEEGPGAWKLYGSISDHLANYLHGLVDFNEQTTLRQLSTRATEAMHQVYYAIIGLAPAAVRNECRADIQRCGNIFLSVPGNGCAVHPAEENTNPLQGYDFHSRNIDNPAQLFALLAGLTSINQTTRQILKC